MQGFRPETVLANPVALQFHDALSGRSKTSVEEYVAGVDLWWAPLFRDSQTHAKLWRDLHLKSDIFKEWVARHKPEYLAAENISEGVGGHAPPDVAAGSDTSDKAPGLSPSGLSPSIQNNVSHLSADVQN